MKRFLIMLILAVLPLTGTAGTGKKAVRREVVTNLISQYRHYDGFEVVRLGPLALSAARSISKVALAAEGDKETLNALKLAGGIRKLAIVEYEDCEENIRNSFNSKLGGILKDAEVLMEVRDEEDTVRMYGVVDDDASSVRDLILFIPEDCTLICLFGTVSMDAVSGIINDMN